MSRDTPLIIGPALSMASCANLTSSNVPNDTWASASCVVDDIAAVMLGTVGKATVAEAGTGCETGATAVARFAVPDATATTSGEFLGSEFRGVNALLISGMSMPCTRSWDSCDSCDSSATCASWPS